VALAAGLFQPRGPAARLSGWRYVDSVLVYLACIPGMLAAVLIAYALFFTGENLLDANLLVYLGPIVSMALTLLLVRRRRDFAELPGFDRLSGLMLVLALTFAIVLAIARSRIWIVFGGSIATLILLAGFVFALLRWAAQRAFRRPGESLGPRPELPRI
jgi:hypothetical protein